MIEFKAEKQPKIALLLDGRVEVTFTTTRAVLGELEGLKEKELNVSVKEYRPKRSLSQNSYMWVLLGNLSAKLGLGSNEIYKGYVKEFGVYEILPIRDEALESFKAKWGKNGLGWFCEEIGKSKLNGYTNIVAYYGSSTYNSKEFTRLIDAVIQDCQAQGINTMLTDEFLALYNENDNEND